MKNTILITFISASLFFSCTKNAVTGKRAFTLLPESEMMAMSFSQYDKFLAEHPPLSDHDDRVKMVRSCGVRIQKAVEKFYADKGMSKQLNGFNWAFNVVDENTVNAWCMPGGKVVVYTGLLPVTQDEAGLAVVMGHEIAHAVARHGNQRMSQGILLQTGGTVLSVAVSQKPQATQALFNQSFGVASALGSLKYSRGHETEADKMGLIFAAMGGYDPEVAVGFWERMSAGGGQKPPELLSTHPSDERRIQDLKAFMPQAKKYYKPQ
ncbi:MAG: M48 family metallopeptidase [Bacteroidota bacterium]|nr:M48 family metallopeptidase [Bacteroidota bacterium]MDP3147296.1 M48 family metallopeptidase [Bacteroidota bacterium]MDP3557330.1 M48 family metallopeptidase [Bacteroidota bacterium]